MLFARCQEIKRGWLAESNNSWWAKPRILKTNSAPLLFHLLWLGLLIHNQNYCDNLHFSCTVFLKARFFCLKLIWHICWIQRFGIPECQDVWLTKPTTRMAPCISSCCGLPLQKAVMLVGVAELVCASCHIHMSKTSIIHMTYSRILSWKDKQFLFSGDHYHCDCTKCDQSKSVTTVFFKNV